MEVRLKEKIPGVFWPVHQAIRRGEVTEVVAKGGRGSGKSSYLSMELVWQLLRHPDCHAVVLRKVGGTLQVAGVAACHGGHFGVFARYGTVLRHVSHDVFAREQEVQFAQALDIALQLVFEKGFHAEKGVFATG